MFKITVEVVGERKTENKHVSVPEFRISVFDTDTVPTDENREAHVAGMLLLAYKEAAMKFMQGHDCDDCPAYLQHSQVVTAINRINRDIFNRIGK